MKTVRYIWGMFVVMLAWSGVVLAQDEDNLDTDINVCVQENYLSLQTHLIDMVNLFGDIEANNPTDVSMQIRATLDAVLHICSSPFTSSNNPTGIIGPLVFDGEIYQVTFAVDNAEDYNYSTLSIIVMEDTCGYLSASLLGEGVMAELFEVNPSFDEDSNCTVMVEIDSPAEWELSFVKIK